MASYIVTMDARTLFESAMGAVTGLGQTDLLLVAAAAMLMGFVASMLARRRVPLAGLLRAASTLTLVGVLVLVVLQISRLDPRFDLALPQAGLPEQRVEGSETRVPLARDGHYWLEAEINGEPARFLVDTGATLTALSPALAEAAGLDARRDRLPVMMTTANGTVRVPMTTIDELRFGNVAARGLDAVIVPNLGETNVIGMNLLSRLKGWRVEEGELILQPNNPQEPLEKRS